MRLDKRWLLILPLIAAPAWADEPKEKPQPKPQPKGTASFRMLATNHMVVRAKINGRGPYRLVFDLGAPITLLSNRAAVESGTLKADGGRFAPFGMRGEATIESLELGDLVARDVPAFVFDHPILKALSNAVGERLDGIVGFTFFARYRTTIDFQAERLTFEPVEYAIKDLMVDLQRRLEAPRVAKERVLAPGARWGLTLGEPAGDVLEPSGVPIQSVEPGSAAAEAGLEPGDALTALDGRWTTSIADVYAAAASIPPGRAVPLAVRRAGAGAERTVVVTPREGL